MTMKTICIKSRNGVDLPIDSTLEIDGREMTVMGLAKREYRDGLIREEWIVQEKPKQQ